MLKKSAENEEFVEEVKENTVDISTNSNTEDIGLKTYQYVEISVKEDLDGNKIPDLFDGEHFILFEIKKDGTCVVIGPNGYTGKFSPGMLKNIDGGTRYVK